MKDFANNLSCIFSKKLIAGQLKLAEANKVIALPHTHNDNHLHSNKMHITYTESGHGFCCVGDKNYEIRPGIMHFVYPNEIHRYYALPEDPYRTYFLHFNCMGKILHGPRTIFITKKKHKKINQLFYKLFYLHHYYKNASKEERIFSLLFELFAEISEYSNPSNTKDKKTSFDFDENFFMDILNSLYMPPFPNPGIDKLARQKNMSRSTFTRAFRRNTGMSVLEYLTQAKLTHAKYLLENSNLPIKQIANQCGYANSQNLKRALKSFSCK